MATKTYFTTSTFYTTYIDKQRTVTRTRTSVRSSVVTDTYSGGQFDFLPGPQQTLSPSIQENPAEKYLSLGPSIYGLVRTLYTTFTYANGLGGESREVITQVSTSVFSTSALPASITAAPVPSLQLDQDTLLSLKQSHISQLSPSLTATYTQTAPLGPASTQTTTNPLPTEVDLPSGGPTLVRPTSSVVTSSSKAPASIAPSQPDPSPAPAPSSLADQQEDSQDGSQESQEAGAGEALAGGLLGAVVGGLSSALIPPSQPPAGLQVDLGPVLDAVATLLRGPIRSAIANRRNTAAVQASERAEVGSQQTASLPQFARLPSTDPNIIPLGAAGPARPVPDRDPQYGFIPLNAPQKYNGQALPRSDTELEAEHSINDINEIPADILNILQDSNNQLDNPVVIDKDKIVINNHIIRTNDPHIIDVLNKYEHSYLYNKPVDDELKIRIAAGEPMQKPQPKPSAQPTSQNTFFGISLPKFNFGGGSRKPVQGKPSVGVGRPAGPVRRPAGRPGNPPARPASPSHPRPSSPSIPRPSNPPPSYNPPRPTAPPPARPAVRPPGPAPPRSPQQPPAKRPYTGNRPGSGFRGNNQGAVSQSGSGGKFQPGGSVSLAPGYPPPSPPSQSPAVPHISSNQWDSYSAPAAPAPGPATNIHATQAGNGGQGQIKAQENVGDKQSGGSAATAAISSDLHSSHAQHSQHGLAHQDGGLEDSLSSVSEENKERYFNTGGQMFVCVMREERGLSL